MKEKNKLTNQQMSSAGMKRADNGEIDHLNEKITESRKKDNVKPKY